MDRVNVIRRNAVKERINVGSWNKEIVLLFKGKEAGWLGTVEMK